MTGRSILQIAAAPVVVLAVWFAASWVPAQSSSASDRARQVEDDRAQLVTEINDAAALAENKSQLDARIETTEAAVPPEARLAGFVSDAGEAGGRAGVIIDQIAPLSVTGPEDVDGQLEQLPSGTSSILLSIGATGTYESLLDFIDELSSFDRLVLIDLIDLNSQDDVTTEVTLDLEVRIFTTAGLSAPPDTSLGDAADTSGSA